MIADSLSPAELDMVHKAFGFDLGIDPEGYVEEFLSEERAEQTVGLRTGEWLWHTAWLFGIVVDDGLNYYVPDDFDTEVPLVPCEHYDNLEVISLI